MSEAPEIPPALPLADVAAVTADALASGPEPESSEPATNPPPVAEIAKEPSPMLDVHPAHHAATSWKEFFIHIATIVLGLLIAVGLEQTVEYIHHRNEVADTREAANSGLPAHRVAVIGVSMMPGHRTLARIAGASSMASTLVKDISPPLEAA